MFNVYTTVCVHVHVVLYISINNTVEPLSIVDSGHHWESGTDQCVLIIIEVSLLQRVVLYTKATTCTPDYV